MKKVLEKNYKQMIETLKNQLTKKRKAKK